MKAISSIASVFDPTAIDAIAHEKIREAPELQNAEDGIIQWTITELNDLAESDENDAVRSAAASAVENLKGLHVDIQETPRNDGPSRPELRTVSPWRR